MANVTYTRNYNTIQLTIQALGLYPYIEVYNQEGEIIAGRERGPLTTDEIVHYFPFETTSWTIKRYQSLATTSQPANPDEIFTYHWPLEGHILLGGQDKYLPLLYNPEVTNLKWNYIDTVTPTLGSAYPVVTRNGNQKYRTFTLSGMISYELDEPYPNLFSGYQFLSKDEINKYRSYSQSADEQDLLIERVFRDVVVDWLQNGQKKVFQSEQEGTMIVYLSNFSWTSNKTLGRHNYSFSCTATEIEEATTANIEAVLK